jgi:hypothetical protein
MGKVRIPQIFAVLFVLGILVGFSAANGQQSAPLSDATQSQREEQNQSVETLKVNVNAVQLFFNVKDRKSALIPNLTKDDFEILEDGKPQTIKYFAAESNLPLTLGILIDSSGSQERVLHMEKQVGGEFLNEIRCECESAAGLHQLRGCSENRSEQRAHRHYRGPNNRHSRPGRHRSRRAPRHAAL